MRSCLDNYAVCSRKFLVSFNMLEFLNYYLIYTITTFTGTKAPPREIQLDNAVLPTDPGMIRVSTPPRVITLDQHYFPSADDFPQGMPTNSPPRNSRNYRSQGDGARSTTPRPDNFNESTMTESRLVLR